MSAGTSGIAGSRAVAAVRVGRPRGKFSKEARSRWLEGVNPMLLESHAAYSNSKHAFQQV